MKDEPTSAGPRNFAAFLAQVDDGCLHAELSETTQDTMKKLREFAVTFSRDAKGEINLKLKFTVDDAGIARVSSEVKATLPKRPRSMSTFFLTASDNLALENPRQQKLPLREIPKDPSAARDVPSDRTVKEA